jgi:hypothetical protein
MEIGIEGSFVRFPQRRAVPSSKMFKNHPPKYTASCHRFPNERMSYLPHTQAKEPRCVIVRFTQIDPTKRPESDWAEVSIAQPVVLLKNSEWRVGQSWEKLGS